MTPIKDDSSKRVQYFSTIKKKSPAGDTKVYSLIVVSNPAKKVLTTAMLQ